MKKYFFFECFRLWHVPIVLIGHVLHWEVSAFDTDLKLKQKRVARFLLARGWLKRIIAHHYPFGDAHTQALAAADRIVDDMRAHPALKAIAGMYGDDEVLLVFKKTLAEKLAVLTSMQTYFRMNPMASDDSIWMFPAQYCALMPMLKKYHIDYAFPDAVRMVGHGLGNRFLSAYYEWIRLSFVFTAYILHILWQCFQSSKPAKKHFKYGISLSSPWFEKFKGGPREFTFLVDDKLIRKDESVFLVEYQNSDVFYHEYHQKGFHLFPAVGSLRVQHIFEPSILSINHEWKYSSQLFFHAWRYSFIRESVVCLLMARLTWGRVLASIQFENYVYCNKEGTNQIAANIFFRSQGITSRHYSQFIGGQYQVDNDITPYDSRNVYWSFLNSDYFMANCQSQVHSLLKQYSAIRNYKVIGNIFADMIRDMDKVATCHKLLSSHTLLEDSPMEKRVVSVFDTSYVNMNNIYSTFDEAAAFLVDFMRLAKTRPNLIFLFKPSKADSYFIDANSMWSSPIKGKRIVALRKELAELRHVVMLGDDNDPVEVIAASDVVITHCFSSPTADALSAAIPAFWYESEPLAQGYPLDEVDGLVAHGYNQLNIFLDNALGDSFLEKLYHQENFQSMVNASMHTYALDDLRKYLKDTGLRANK